MNVTIEIDDARLAHYSLEAKNELQRQLNTIADNLAEEANRIEAGRRLPTSTSEVTQSDVSAAGILSKMNKKAKKSKWWYVCQLLVSISGWFSGWLFDEDKFKEDPWRLYAFMLSLGVLLISTTLTIMKDGNK